ncbi:hypothetical protein PoB_000184200 [Plakobranchus ocellatus]|uniref:Uncharacterized protein n=1 Tax=Plakobranchus ocellatus TaxID=259542 RepID=A0AAV3XZP8_9GAST|nr:hypothetical protein PoB_000184200 [Plakobranchus ocellatus]
MLFDWYNNDDDEDDDDDDDDDINYTPDNNALILHILSHFKVLMYPSFVSKHSQPASGFFFVHIVVHTKVISGFWHSSGQGRLWLDSNSQKKGSAIFRTGSLATVSTPKPGQI